MRENDISENAKYKYKAYKSIEKDKRQGEIKERTEMRTLFSVIGKDAVLAFCGLDLS